MFFFGDVYIIKFFFKIVVRVILGSDWLFGVGFDEDVGDGIDEIKGSVEL